MFYTEKQVQRMIDERLRQEMMEMHNSRRFEEIEERINGLYKRVCECECRLEELMNRNGEVNTKCEKP